MENENMQPVTAKQHMLELKTPIILSRKGRHGEPKTVVFRIEAGQRVIVLARDPDPRNQTPFVCVHPMWGASFYVGKGHKQIEVTLQRKLSDDHEKVEWEVVSEVEVQ